MVHFVLCRDIGKMLKIYENLIVHCQNFLNKLEMTDIVILFSLLGFLYFLLLLISFILKKIAFFQSEKRTENFSTLDKASRAIYPIVVETPSGAMRGGTGVVIGQKGLFVTNHHVVAERKRLSDPDKMFIRKCSKTLGIKKIEAAESLDDMALLRIKLDTPMKDFVPLRNKNNPIRIGDRIWIVGFPETSDGEILDRAITSGYVEEIDPYQIKTSATIGPGSSGSAILDYNGHLVGIAHSSSKESEYDGSFPKSYGFTADVIRDVLDSEE